MLYLARLFHLTDGTVRHNTVIVVESGIVNEFYSFSAELQSMTLLDEVYLSVLPDLKYLSDTHTVSPLQKAERLYAYSLSDDGRLLRLE